MSVIEKFSTISNTITKLIEFVSTDETVKDDFNDYLLTIGAKNMTPAQVQAMLVPYIFERRLFEERKGIIDLYIEKNTKLDTFTKKLLASLKNSFSSIYEIKKVVHNGFELVNLINEKKYNVLSLVKMTNYRGVYAGQYAMCRIFNFEDDFYILEVSNIVSSAKKEEVQKFAIAKIIERPEEVYLDNPEKLKEIEKQVSNFSEKFTECFGKDEIVTTNQHADILINIFNNYCENQNDVNCDEITENIKEPDEYKYFHVPEFDSSYSNFVEKSMGGFSSHNALYDVGIVYDKDLGLFAIPFYATFKKVFEVEDSASIQGGEGCVKSFLENDRIPYQIIKKVADASPKFMSVVNKILDKNYTFDELMEFYKSDSIKNKVFSPTSVLYSSKIFSEVMGFVIEETDEATKPKVDYSNVGRNDPCPCGSGKKYKKCCMNN
ncbi:MAG: SEC-C domain-containing protein [Candidatus Gastranaerophilales bacterium]|nr:SEC-C domain-containing protein [Candidatus Gastranaerophilales bacterium]